MNQNDVIAVFGVMFAFRNNIQFCILAGKKLHNNWNYAEIGNMKMKKEHEKILWIGVAAASFTLAVCLSIGMIFAVHYGLLKGEEGLFIRYIIAIALGASTATLTVGALRAKASITGKKLGIHIELGGASAVLALTVFGAFYFTSNPSFNQGFYLEDSVTERKLSSDSMKVILNLGTGPIESTVGPNGFLEYKNLPSSLRNTECEISTGSPSYIIIDEFSKVMLDGITRTIKVKRNDKIMRTFRRKVNYELIKLLIPFRIMAGEKYGDDKQEIPVAEYQRPEVIKTLITIPLNHDPGNLSLEDFRRMFVYLPDEPFYKQELLNARGTYGERLAQTAMDFVEFYQNMSQLERSYISEKELTLLHELRSTLMMERMKNIIGIKLSDDETLIEMELIDYLEKIEAIERKMGPFEMLFVTF